MLKNMKIGFKISLSLGLLLLFIIGMMIIGLKAIKDINTEMGSIVNVENVRTQIVNNMINNAQETVIDLRGIIIKIFCKFSKESIQSTKDHFEALRGTYIENVGKYEKLLPKELVPLNEQLVRIKTSRDSAWLNQDKVLSLLSSGKVIEGTDILFNIAYPSVQNWIKNSDDLIKMEDESTLKVFANAQKLYTDVRTTLIILGLIAFAIALTISVILTLSIIRPLKVSVEAASRIASNDLSVIISPGERKDEVGILSQAFRKMIENLRGSVIDINEAVNLLGSSASEILAATTQVASGTAETATAISETTTTVEEVRQAAKLSAQKAKNVADSAQKLAQVSQNGQIAVDETVKGMNRIREQMDSIAQTVVRLSEQSQSIGGIIASVTDIADQSNLLAVNAAIEAAKAGEHGKGFAVVAQEIKNLAEQSKQSTSQVRNILNDVQKATSTAVMATEQGSKAVEAGVKQSALAGEAIRILTESSNEAVQATTQIVASSQQQVIGMDQIGVAMQNINQAGTETAVSMIQSEKAARNLNELGQKLKDLVERFKV
jgi:methyl-accepting chemotaxis protein